LDFFYIPITKAETFKIHSDEFKSVFVKKTKRLEERILPGAVFN